MTAASPSIPSPLWGGWRPRTCSGGEGWGSVGRSSEPQNEPLYPSPPAVRRKVRQGEHMTATDDDARALRRAWFDYLDTVEAVRAPLHAYGMKLTGNVWDAEDL